MIEGSGSGSRAKSGSGSIPLTSGSGSGRPKNMWIRWIRIQIRIRIRIRNTGTAYLPSILKIDICDFVFQFYAEHVLTMIFRNKITNLPQILILFFSLMWIFMSKSPARERLSKNKLRCLQLLYQEAVLRIQILDPVPFRTMDLGFLDPGSGILNPSSVTNVLEKVL